MSLEEYFQLLVFYRQARPIGQAGKIKAEGETPPASSATAILSKLESQMECGVIWYGTLRSTLVAVAELARRTTCAEDSVSHSLSFQPGAEDGERMLL